MKFAFRFTTKMGVLSVGWILVDRMHSIFSMARSDCLFIQHELAAHTSGSPARSRSALVLRCSLLVNGSWLSPGSLPQQTSLDPYMLTRSVRKLKQHEWMPKY